MEKKKKIDTIEHFGLRNPTPHKHKLKAPTCESYMKYIQQRRRKKKNRITIFESKCLC